MNLRNTSISFGELHVRPTPKKPQLSAERQYQKKFQQKSWTLCKRIPVDAP
jgi:hypothetical protein